MSNEQNFEVRDFNDSEWYWIHRTVIPYTKKVSLAGIAVYNILASMVDSEQKCFPSQKYIGDLLGCTRSYVNRLIKSLELNGLIGIERKGRFHRVYYLLRCQPLEPVHETTKQTEETQVLSIVNQGVNHSDNNDNHLIKNINNIDIDNIKTGEHQKEFTPKTRAELLALDLADALNDRKGLAMYLSYSRRFPESLLRKALGEAKEMPEEQIRKSRAALFNHLVRKYVKEFKNYKNNRDQSGN